MDEEEKVSGHHKKVNTCSLNHENESQSERGKKKKNFSDYYKIKERNTNIFKCFIKYSSDGRLQQHEPILCFVNYSVFILRKFFQIFFLIFHYLRLST